MRGYEKNKMCMGGENEEECYMKIRCIIGLPSYPVQVWTLYCQSPHLGPSTIWVLVCVFGVGEVFNEM